MGRRKIVLDHTPAGWSYVRRNRSPVDTVYAHSKSCAHVAEKNAPNMKTVVHIMLTAVIVSETPVSILCRSFLCSSRALKLSQVAQELTYKEEIAGLYLHL